MSYYKPFCDDAALGLYFYGVNSVFQLPYVYYGLFGVGGEGFKQSAVGVEHLQLGDGALGKYVEVG